MKIYLAARYDQHPLMRDYATRLEAAGHHVTSRWIRAHADDAPDGCTVALINAEPDSCAPFAEEDFQDIREADTVVCFTEWPSSTGGRHVEVGYALGLGLRVVVVGPREHIFHALETVEHYPTREAFETAWMLSSLDLVRHLHRQRKFSLGTFGPGSRVDGVLDHIAKEIVEVRESGGALEEWVDLVILALDGSWRSGASPEQVVAAIVAKQAKNEARTWPDWRTAEPGKALEHVRSA